MKKESFEFNESASELYKMRYKSSTTMMLFNFIVTRLTPNNGPRKVGTTFFRVLRMYLFIFQKFVKLFLGIVSQVSLPVTFKKFLHKWERQEQEFIIELLLQLRRPPWNFQGVSSCSKRDNILDTCLLGLKLV